MRAVYELDGKRVTKTRLAEAIGLERVNELRDVAWRSFVDKQYVPTFVEGNRQVRVAWSGVRPPR